MPRRRHRGKIERNTSTVQMHGSLQHRFKFTLTTGRREHDGFGSAHHETFLGRMRERGVGIEFDPNIHAEIRQRAYRGGKTHGLANAAAPIGGIARFAGTAIACHRAEKWNFVRLRFEIGERSFQRLRRRSHDRMMERMIDPNQSRKPALRLELGSYGPKRRTLTPERDRTWAIEGGD